MGHCDELREDPAGEPLELPHVARMGKRRVTNVVVQIEVRVVDPDRVLGERNRRELLAQTRSPV